MNNIELEIKRLEKQLESFPKGTLVYKKINGIKQPYLQQTINNKSKSTYIKKDDLERVLKELIKRDNLISKIKELKASSYYSNVNIIKEDDLPFFRSSVLLSSNLINFSESARNFKKRYCYYKLHDYLYNNDYGKVFILYGLRRTGKTTIIKQTLLDMKMTDLLQSAFIQISPNSTLADLYADLKTLQYHNYKYVFIDEITLLKDFIDGSALLPDIFVSCGMKIVLSGTDSLSFWLSEDNQLYDRTIVAHTTYISYYEFENVLGIKGIDNYICYGGTMSFDGKQYNKLFKNEKSINEYIDSAIAHNIQHSLAFYQDGGHFRALSSLYENGELTSAINRVVEDTNHRFTIDVLTSDFISHDLGVSARNIRKDDDILDKVDTNEITRKLKEELEILNKSEQKITINDEHRYEIQEYLFALDLINQIEIKRIPNTTNKSYMTVISQPGLRYSQAKILINKLIQDNYFESYGSKNKIIVERILSEIKGRMLEEIVLLETKLSMEDKQVFKLQFDRGEFDMVVFDENTWTSNIYEIKHSDKIVEEQYKNLIDKTKCELFEKHYGAIENKIVIYRGKTTILDNGIKYINIEEYLSEIGQINYKKQD